MSKFNVGDKVRIKGDLSKCEFGYSYYMERFAGKKATVINTFGKGGIKLDIDKQVWNWSENVLELIEESDNMNTKIEEGNKVNESDLKDTETSKEVKDDKNDPVNPFMEEYKKIVTETMNLCEKKNKDYGNATDESFKQFGDVSYQVRCFDKWSRINTLLKNGKAEVSESLEDSLLDLSNYLFLWVTSRRLKENN